MERLGKGRDLVAVRRLGTGSWTGVQQRLSQNLLQGIPRNRINARNGIEDRANLLLIGHFAASFSGAIECLHEPRGSGALRRSAKSKRNGPFLSRSNHVLRGTG